MRVRHPSDRDGRGAFEHLSEHASNFTASRLFMGLCVVLVVAFVAVHALGMSLEAQLAAGDAMTAVTLSSGARRRSHDDTTRAQDMDARFDLRVSAGRRPLARLLGRLRQGHVVRHMP
ncbi:hypothetical protein [Streptacidiphilus rugosus]|uniref:hypothetical protein n=1 Tax=Streptacidiphilus rugosus TaxID=405783 RepID=UPI000690891C|nr:hypothetical protein [Streptacidiphilus rugosus]